MSDAPANSGVKLSDTQQRIGRALAVALTIAIVVVVFWGYRPWADRPQGSGDGGGPPGGFRGPEWINETPQGIRRAMAGPVMMEVFGRPGTTFTFSVRIGRFASVPGLDPDSTTLLRIQRQILRDPGAVKAAEVSEQQMDQLQAATPNLTISDSDQEQIKHLWSIWEQADADHKAAAERAVLEALRSAGEKGMEDSRKKIIESAKTVKSILSTDQVAKLALYMESNPMPFGRQPMPSPSTQPG
jgi:hypothetical protein